MIKELRFKLSEKIKELESARDELEHFEILKRLSLRHALGGFASGILLKEGNISDRKLDLKLDAIPNVMKFHTEILEEKRNRLIKIRELEKEKMDLEIEIECFES